MTALRRTTVRALAALGLAVVPLGATAQAAPAHAALVQAAAAPDGAVELSVDGSTWSQDVTTPLFDPAFVWVPGDVETGTLYVRTRACAAATGEATVTVGPEEAELARDLDTRTRVDGGAWSAGTSTPAFTVGRGDVARIDVEVTFDPASGNASQSRTVPLDVIVTLACDEGPGPTPGRRRPPRRSGPRHPGLP